MLLQHVTLGAARRLSPVHRPFSIFWVVLATRRFTEFVAAGVLRPFDCHALHRLASAYFGASFRYRRALLFGSCLFLCWSIDSLDVLLDSWYVDCLMFINNSFYFGGLRSSLL